MPTTKATPAPTQSVPSDAGTSKRLRGALTANAALSLATGLLLTIAPASVASWLDVSITGWLRLFGIALLGHAVVLWWARAQPSGRRWAQLNFAMIAPYPLALVGVLIVGLVSSGVGRTLVLLDAALVAAVAVAHWLGLRSSD